MSHLNQSSRSALNELLGNPTVGAQGIEVSRGTVIYDQGSAAENVYLIHHGQIRLYQVGPDGQERLIEILGPGQWFGTAALASQPNASQAIAATEAQLSKVPAAPGLGAMAS